MGELAGQDIMGIMSAFGLLFLLAKSMVGSYKRGEMKWPEVRDVEWEDEEDDEEEYEAPKVRRGRSVKFKNY